MTRSLTFQRRGIVEGFFGPLWSMAHRKRLFAFGQARGMNTYLYAPKDDPYHRLRWRFPYPPKQWRELTRLISTARRSEIAFVYGFHPGAGLCFSDDEPVRILLRKAQRFYDAGVRTFAVLFDDIPSRLTQARDRRQYCNSLARAEGNWLGKIVEHQPSSWHDVEWWICPSYYTPDPLLARVFGAFEDNFLEKLAETLPQDVACMWTGPAVVPKEISLAHVRKVQRRIARRLILWDNYPVNDLSMADELHIGPLLGRDPRLPQHVYGYLNNPLLQQELSFMPLATCFDYARAPRAYRPEVSWRTIVEEKFGAADRRHWRNLRLYCERRQAAKKNPQSLQLTRPLQRQLLSTLKYFTGHRRRAWALELKNWLNQMGKDVLS
ncbi:MAG: hypothetical protein FJ143_09965 [Deltaproteobacteria bacterium]|nr:hypothetical protein [Deltaproteobacteria bacterium]MBM4298052.1 hypothetical protein [Deltaproteobacteria bacterium]